MKESGSESSEWPVVGDVVVPELVVHEGAGHEELVIVELAGRVVLVEVLPEEASELAEVDAAPDLGHEGVGEVGEHRDAAAAMRVNHGGEPGPQALSLLEVIGVLDVGGEENVEDVVLEPGHNHVDEGFVVVQDHVTVDAPHVVSGEGAANIHVGAGHSVDVVVLVSRGDGKESHKEEGSFHLITFISINF